MTARVVEKIMNTLLSMLMVVVFFIILAPFWTMFYSGVLLRDYLAALRV